MKFNVTYTKITHHLFYLQNMTLWRYFCHPEYNDAWLKITGSLSTEEQKAVQELKDILSAEGKYGELVDHTFNKESLPSDEKVRKIFKTTGGSFEKIWGNIKDDLPKAKENLETNLKQHENVIKEILKRLRIFYNTDKALPKFTDVYIILLPKIVQCGGGKFGGKNNVVLEGNFQRLNSSLSIEVILHEMIHLYFEDYLENELYPKFEKEIEYHPLKETVAAALLPHGYFSHKFFSAALNQSTKNYQLIKLAENYLESSKAIDNSFIKQCVDFIKRKPG